MRHIRALQIANIDPAASEKSKVLDAFDGSADSGVGDLVHGCVRG
jgi:hypothetical protein